MSKIPATTLADTYLYDIPTQAGEEITLVGGTLGIVNVSAPKPYTSHDHALYNLSGQHVDESYHGIVVTGGKKYVK